MMGQNRVGGGPIGRTETLFVATAFTIQMVLTGYFALRTWSLDTALEIGWVVYAMAVPAVLVSVVLARSGAPWSFWLGGPLYAAWTMLGYYVDIADPVEWRSPILPSVFLPYVGLYLAAMMLYWWPLGRIDRRLWFAYAVLFVVGSTLNLASHG